MGDLHVILGAILQYMVSASFGCLFFFFFFFYKISCIFDTKDTQ